MEEKKKNLICYHCHRSSVDCKCPDDPEEYHFIEKVEETDG